MELAALPPPPRAPCAPLSLALLVPEPSWLTLASVADRCVLDATLPPWDLPWPASRLVRNALPFGIGLTGAGPFVELFVHCELPRGGGAYVTIGARTACLGFVGLGVLALSGGTLDSLPDAASRSTRAALAFAPTFAALLVDVRWNWASARPHVRLSGATFLHDAARQLEEEDCHMHEAPRAVALGFLLSSLACTVTYSVAALPPTPAFALASAAARWERLESRMRRPIARPTVSGGEASPAEHIWALEFAAGPARFALPPSSDGRVLLSMRSGPGVDPAPPIPRESCALVPRVTSGQLRPFSLCAVSWNVRSLLKTGARQTLASFLAQQGCAVAFLQETRGQSEAFRAVGACPQSEGGAASYSVFATGADTRAGGGCQVWVRTKGKGSIPHASLHVAWASPRAIVVTAMVGGRRVSLVSAYGPTVAHDASPADEFWEELSGRVAQIGLPVLMGMDCNAHFGRDEALLPGGLVGSRGGERACGAAPAVLRAVAALDVLLPASLEGSHTGARVIRGSGRWAGSGSQ